MPKSLRRQAEKDASEIEDARQFVEDSLVQTFHDLIDPHVIESAEFYAKLSSGEFKISITKEEPS